MKTFVPLTICVLLFACSAVVAQDKKKSGFDVSKFLKRLDSNQNGKVEPSEIKDDRTRGFLEKAGVDTSKSISISGFAKKIEKQKSARRNQPNGQKTAGFLVDREEPGSTLTFAVTDEERAPPSKSSSSRSKSYSEGATKMMEWTLKKYDKNKDGKLDANEIKAGRWSDPSAKESDKNRDGNLSRSELLARYQEREDRKAKSKERSSRRFRSSKSSSKSSDSKTSSRKRSSESKSSKDRSSGSDRGKRDVRKGYESYVDGLFKSYDKNKNGQLEKDEIEKMRKKPSMKADTNDDKQISKSELLDSYLEKAGVKTGSAKSSSSDKRSGSRKESSTSSNKNARPQLTAKDKNKNGQIEMAEFASEWTLEKVEEFYKKDKNRDGIITASEWNAK